MHQCYWDIFNMLEVPANICNLNKLPWATFCCLFLFLTLAFLLQCNNNEIRPGKHIGVCISVANNRLFVGSIPKSKTKEQILEEFAKVTGESTTLLNIFCNIYSTASLVEFMQICLYFLASFVWFGSWNVAMGELISGRNFMFVSKWWLLYNAGVTCVTLIVYR